MRRDGAIVAVLTGLITAAALTGDAFAAFVSYTGSVEADSSGPLGDIATDSEITGPLPPGLLVRTLLAETPAQFLGFGVASARGSAFPGALHGFVFTEGGVTLGIPGFPNPSAGGQARQFLEWGDRLTLLGDSTLPPGTRVQVRTTLSLASEITLSGRGCSPGFSGPTAEARLLVQGFFVLPIVNSFCDAPPPVGTVNEVFDSEASEVFESVVGASVDVTGFLGTTASARASSTASLVRAIVDAENTAVVHIDCLTPGCSYTTDSGFSYTTPRAAVPEPGTLALIGFGMAALGIARRKRISR